MLAVPDYQCGFALLPETAPGCWVFVRPVPVADYLVAEQWARSKWQLFLPSLSSCILQQFPSVVG